jgi:hypothetical protein
VVESRNKVLVGPGCSKRCPGCLKRGAVLETCVWSFEKGSGKVLQLRKGVVGGWKHLEMGAGGSIRGTGGLTAAVWARKGELGR